MVRSGLLLSKNRVENKRADKDHDTPFPTKRVAYMRGQTASFVQLALSYLRCQ